MIKLETPPTAVELNLAGSVRYLSHTEVTVPWTPLSGGWLPVLSNPVLFGMFGYNHGQSTIDGVAHFRLPDYNAGDGVDATFVRAWNSKNSNGRNLSKTVGTHVAGQIKSHTHSGGTSSGGSHSHPSVSGSKLTGSSGPVFTSAAGGQNSVRYGPTTGSAGHSSHSHSAGYTSGSSIPAENNRGLVEPASYGAVLCIHLG